MAKMHGSLAYQMYIEDPKLRAYLQKNAFCTGPDPEVNRAGKAAIQSEFRPRPAAAGTFPTSAPNRLTPEQTAMPSDVAARLEQLMDAVSLDPARRPALINDFAWEALLAPRESKNLLVIGSGDGIEILFLRAVLPDARITAVDYSNEMPEVLKQATGVRFFGGDMNDILESFGTEFDLISSNHTLEHLYTPNDVLAVFKRLLLPGGTLMSTMPMDAVSTSPFVDELDRIAASPHIKPFDWIYIDAGHPWKTNVADLYATLGDVGFGEVRMFQRTLHLSRATPGSEAEFAKQKNFGLTLHRLFFGIPRTIGNAVLPDSLATPAVRVLQAIEQRVWFGTNRLKNNHTEEVCFLAKKEA